MKNYFYITPKDYEAANKIGLSKKDVYRRVYDRESRIQKWIVKISSLTIKAVLGKERVYGKLKK